MGTSAQGFVLLGSLTVSMKLLLLVCLLPLALSEPGYGHHHHQRSYGPQCRTVYDTVSSSDCKAVTDTACTTRLVTSSRTETREESSSVRPRPGMSLRNTVPPPQRQSALTSSKKFLSRLARQWRRRSVMMRLSAPLSSSARTSRLCTPSSSATLSPSALTPSSALLSSSAPPRSSALLRPRSFLRRPSERSVRTS